MGVSPSLSVCLPNACPSVRRLILQVVESITHGHDTIMSRLTMCVLLLLIGFVIGNVAGSLGEQKLADDSQQLLAKKDSRSKPHNRDIWDKVIQLADVFLNSTLMTS
ncbi:hypothetical protein Btru_034977 [Bulinus truncatus]|nr:hypothetical protein Btru_034977 [Bulinus truncatus]